MTVLYSLFVIVPTAVLLAVSVVLWAVVLVVGTFLDGLRPKVRPTPS
jgi:hypothetical protein